MFLKYVSHPKLLALFSVGILFIVFGTIVFMLIEGWNLLDALYYTVSTITTVGYGDFVPTHPLSKLIATIYMIAIVPAVLIGIGVVAEVMHERRHGFFKKKEG